MTNKDNKINKLLGEFGKATEKRRSLHKQIEEIDKQMGACLQIFGFTPKYYTKKEVRKAKNKFSLLGKEKELLEKELAELD